MNERLRGPVMGASTALAWVAGLVVSGAVAGGSPLAVVAQAVIEASPGVVATAAIETLGPAAQPLLVAGIAVAVVAAGAVAGRYWNGTAGTQVRAVGVVAVVAVTGALVFAAADGPAIRWAVATGVALLPLAVYRWAQMREAPVVGRRRALGEIGLALGAAAGVGVAGEAANRLTSTAGADDGIQPGQELTPTAEKTQQGTTTPAGSGGTVTGTPTVTASTPGMAANVEKRGGVTVSTADSDAEFEFGFEGMPKKVASAEDHYVVDKDVTNPRVDPGEWTLNVGGRVDDEYDLTLSDLIGHEDARDLTVTTVCISNPVGGNLISTVQWRGVPVRALFEDAGVTDGVKDVVTQAVDGYTEALPWEVVKERDDIVIAYGMDGDTLPREHGFPARLLVPGRYGMKSTKWVEGVGVIDGDHESYWESRGWDEEAVVNTLSYVRAVQRRGDRVAVGGIAYAGKRGVKRVEVSVDGGTTWGDATLEDPPSPHAWRRFRRVVDRPKSGAMDVVVRATDGNGNRQTQTESDPHPTGSTGWHRVTVSL